MKIDRITLYHLSMPLVAPFETSFGRSDSRDCILIEIFSEGISGFGECVADRDPGYSSETSGTAWHIIRDFLAPMMLGADFSNASDFNHSFDHVRGHLMAKAGLEMALWDLLGKAQGRPLRQLLGGERERVDVGVSVGIQASPDALVKVVESFLSPRLPAYQN